MISNKYLFVNIILAIIVSLGSYFLSKWQGFLMTTEDYLMVILFLSTLSIFNQMSPVIKEKEK